MLSNEFKVACEIYKADVQKEHIWFTRLVERLEPNVSKNTISDSLDTLSDWGIIKGEYSRIDTDQFGVLFQIHNEHKDRIKEIYELYYENK